MPKGSTAILLVLLAAGACGSESRPAARTDVERGTALPPPGLSAPPAAATPAAATRAAGAAARR